MTLILFFTPSSLAVDWEIAVVDDTDTVAIQHPAKCVRRSIVRGSSMITPLNKCLGSPVS